MTPGSRSAWLWLALWLTVAAISAWFVSRATIVSDITAFLPGPATPAQAQLAQQLRDGAAARVALIGVEGNDTDKLAKVSHALAAQLRRDPRFAWVANGSAAALASERDRLLSVRYLVSPRVNARRFSEPGLRAAATELEALLRSSAAPLVSPFAAHDFTGELLAILGEFGSRGAPPTRHDAWFDTTGRTAILLATTRAPGFDVDAQADARAAIEAAFSAAVLASGAAAKLIMTGPGMFAVESRAVIRHDAERLALIAALLVGALLYVALRSGRLLLVAALPVGIGALAGLAVVAATFGAIHGITLGFGVTLIGEAVDYAIYVQVQQRGIGADRWLWRALWLAVLTSSAGFIAMMLSGFQGLAQLGLLSIVGITVAAAVARTLLPKLLKPLPVDALTRLRWVERVPAIGLRLRGVALLFAALALALLAIRAPTFWNDELAAISPLARSAGEADARLRNALGMPDLRYVIALDGATLDEALARAESLQPALSDLVARGGIAGFASPAQLVPSRAQQALRRAALPDETTLRANLDAALQGTALRAAAFEPFIADVQAARSAPWIVPDTYQGTGLGERLAGQIHLSTDRATVFITLTGVSDADALRSALRDSPAALLDLKADVETLIAHYRGRAATAALGGGLLIVVLLLVHLRDVRATARITLALAVAVAITAAALVVIEGRLTLFHLVALLLVAGIGSNYALFFGLPPAHGVEQSVAVPASVLLCMASTLIAFALLATSSTPVLHMIGLTGALGAVISFITAVALAQPK